MENLEAKALVPAAAEGEFAARFQASTARKTSRSWKTLEAGAGAARACTSATPGSRAGPAPPWSSRCVDNSVDEALAGACTEITVTLHSDGSVSIEDNGRGMRLKRRPEHGISTVEIVLDQVARPGATVRINGYKVSGGLHGVGVSVVNALSEWLEVEVLRDGHHGTTSVSSKARTSPLRECGRRQKARVPRSGSSPDSAIFTQGIEFHYDILGTRLQELAFLNRGLKNRAHRRA